MTKKTSAYSASFCHWSFVILSSFVIRHSSFRQRSWHLIRHLDHGTKLSKKRIGQFAAAARGGRGGPGDGALHAFVRRPGGNGVRRVGFSGDGGELFPDATRRPRAAGKNGVRRTHQSRRQRRALYQRRIGNFHRPPF